MNANTYEAEKQVENGKSGTQTGHISTVSHFPTELSKAKKGGERAAKSSVDYWKNKVCPRIIRGAPTPELYARLREEGRDTWVCLDTANKATAATKARDLWVNVRAKGLDTALAEFHPKAAPRPARVCTVADYLTAAKALSTVRPTTLADYESALRRTVGSVLGVRAKTRTVADLAAWRTKIDAVRLDQITPSDVKAWQKRELDNAKAKGGETAKDRRAHTLASDIRDARSLFAEDIVAEAGKTLTLPSPLPFEGITAAATTRRFVCSIDARALYAAATTLDADTRTAFNLLLCAGLRRGEADALPWAHVDLKAGTVRIDVTPTFRPKSKESYRTVPLPTDVVAQLKARRQERPDAELVLESRITKTARKAVGDKTPVYNYRAKAWPNLTAWLKTQGLDNLTPLHALRKLSGSFIYAVAGLEAARLHLGHSNIATTAASYLAARTVTVDLSAKPEGEK